MTSAGYLCMLAVSPGSMGGTSQFATGSAGCQRFGRDAQNHYINTFMAKITPLSTAKFLPAFIAEPLKSGTDHLMPAGLPLDLASITADAMGKKNIEAGAIVNRLFAQKASGLFKLWTGTGTPDALEEFYIVPFAVMNLENTEAACNGLRPGTLIYEDRLPAYYQALSAALKAQIGAKYQIIFARKVAPL